VDAVTPAEVNALAVFWLVRHGYWFVRLTTGLHMESLN